jgi:hypothetical protein
MGVSKTKTYENEDRRPKMGLRNYETKTHNENEDPSLFSYYENEDPLRKRRPIFVFVLYENEDHKIFIYTLFS